MKSVGIITMHKVLNVGSALQAYATQTIIDKLGYSSFLIDYKYPNELQFSNGQHYSIDNEFTPYYFYYNDDTKTVNPWWKPRLKKLYRYLCYQRIRFKNTNDIIAQQYHLFDTFYKKYFKCTKPYYSLKELNSNPPKADIYVTGSDQVWNPYFAKGDLGFLLGFINDGNKIAFSASFAQKNIDIEFKESFKPYLQEYSSISLRENNGVPLIKELTGKDVKVTLDPTLLLNSQQWDAIKTERHSDKYILLYLLDYAFDPKPDIIQAANYYSTKFGLKVKFIGHIIDCKETEMFEKIRIYGPIEFINLVSNAEMVITSSFHGTSFAINYLKPLIAYVSTNQSDDRQTSLLDSVGASSSIIKIGQDYTAINPFYNKEEVNKKLISERKKSILWLNSALDAFNDAI